MHKILWLVAVVVATPGAAVVHAEQFPYAQAALVPEDLRLRPPAAVPANVGDVVRSLVSQGTVLNFPAKGKLKHSINKGAATFDMPGGPSTVALVRLPEYQQPYSLRIKSSRRGIGRTTEIFIPGGLYFDEAFQLRSSFGEEQITWIVEGLVTSLNFGDEHRTVRYLLLYTRGDLVGQQVDMRATYLGVQVPGKVGTFLGNNFGLGRLERSLEAKLELQRDTKFRATNPGATNRLAGMTQEQLRAQFGPPSSAQDSTWYYDTAKGTLRIVFNNGVVSEAHPGDFDLTTLPIEMSFTLKK